MSVSRVVGAPALLLLLSGILCLAANRPLAQFTRMDGPVEKVIVTETFTLVSFNWVADGLSNATDPVTVTVCGDIDLTGGDAVTDFQYSMVYGTEGTDIQRKGELYVDNNMCAVFPMSAYPTTEEQEYELFVINPNDDTAKHGFATFSMLLSVGRIVTIVTDELYRAVGVESTLPQGGCFPDDLPEVCYTDDLTIFDTIHPCQNVTTTAGGTVLVCQDDGAGAPTFQLPAGGFDIDYLQYAANATLHITMMDFDSKNIEVVVGKGSDAPHVYACIQDRPVNNDYECTITNFVQSYSTYAVTVVGLDTSGVPISSGQDSFIDLNVFVYQEPPMVEFNFVRGLSTSLYEVSLYEGGQSGLPSVQDVVDCGSMDIGDVCFGSMLPEEIHLGGHIVYVYVQYTSVRSKIIRVPYTVQATVPPVHFHHQLH